VNSRKATSKAGASVGQPMVQTWAAEPIEASFAEVVGLIEQARRRAYQAVNTELVGLNWQIGQYISGKLAAAVWGEGVVDRLAQHLACTMPGQRGFTRRNLFRMRQFFEAYSGDEKVTPLVTQLPWTNNLIILTQSKRPEERESLLIADTSADRGPPREGFFEGESRRSAHQFTPTRLRRAIDKCVA